jgi:cell division initiation protein
MPLTPLDIHNKEFSRAFRGYREDEVDDFLDLLVREFEALLRDNAALRERVQELDKSLQHYRNLEETLNKALLVAQETARELKANAEKEALLAIRQAEQQAARIVEDAQSRIGRAHAEYEELRRRAQVFRVRMRNFLVSQLELFQEGPEESPVTVRPAPETPRPIVEPERMSPPVQDGPRQWSLDELGPLEDADREAAITTDEPRPPATPPVGERPSPSDRPASRRHWLDDLLDEEKDRG